MARIKYYNTETGKWEYADSHSSAGNVDLIGVVKSINGQTPDENGNVEIEVSGGNVDLTGGATAEPAEDDMPKVFLTGSEFGNMTTAKNEVNMGLEYISKTDKFKADIKIKFQGNTSLTFPKKNFTIKMYTDDSYEDKLKKNFKDWNHSGNKYVLKANYIDHSHARNIVAANLWSEVVASRSDYDSLPVELRNSPRNGAIDGFPVKLYVNGTYQGVYTWNVGKDDWMWGMDEDNANHVLMCAEANTGASGTPTACNFQTLWNGSDGNHWSVEVGTNSTALKNSLNNLIQFVMDNDGDDFKNGIGNYLDVQSAIDYYIFQYEICGLDGLGKNMLLATYDGTKWICGAYDMDAVFGLWWNGSKFISSEYRCPEDYEEPNSTLWKRIEANYMPELKARQAELRKTVLSYSNMVTHFERFMDIIGLDLYAEDLTIYTGIPSGSTNNIKQIRDFIRDRQSYVDAEFAAMSDPVPCTGITLDKSALTFTEVETQTITATVTPSDTTDPVVWVSSAPGVAAITVDGNVCTVQSVGNGNATITVSCGGYSAKCAVVVSGVGEIEGYTPVQYIESDGKQYIDTEITGGATSAYEIKFNPLTSMARSYEMYFAGKKIAPPTSKIYLEGNTSVTLALVNGGEVYGFATLDGQDYVVRVAENGALTINGETSDKVASANGWGDISPYLFNGHEESTLMSSMRLYYCKMWKDGVLVRDFIPAMRDEDGALGLLDSVSRTFFVNKGTGTFESNIPCTGISLDKSTLTFADNTAQRLTATVTPNDCTDEITWETDNENVASVFGGVVTPLGNGSAVITARCGEYSAVCSVEVSNVRSGFLYIWGNTCTATTGGWNQSEKSSISLTFGEDCMYGQGCMVTARKIDLTNVSKLLASVTVTHATIPQCVRLGIMSEANSVALWDSTEPQVQLTEPKTEETLISLDVSGVTGEYYVAVSFNNSNASAIATFYKVWME